VGTGGFSWIYRWSKTKGMAPKGVPSEPHSGFSTSTGRGRNRAEADSKHRPVGDRLYSERLRQGDETAHNRRT